MREPTLRLYPLLPANVSGVVSVDLDLSQPPFSSGPFGITPGSNWNFQFAYRDGTGLRTKFNGSDAVHLCFAP